MGLYRASDRVCGLGALVGIEGLWALDVWLHVDAIGLIRV